MDNPLYNRYAAVVQHKELKLDDLMKGRVVLLRGGDQVKISGAFSAKPTSERLFIVVLDRQATLETLQDNNSRALLHGQLIEVFSGRGDSVIFDASRSLKGSNGLCNVEILSKDILPSDRIAVANTDFSYLWGKRVQELYKAMFGRSVSTNQGTFHELITDISRISPHDLKSVSSPFDNMARETVPHTIAGSVIEQITPTTGIHRQAMENLATTHPRINSKVDISNLTAERARVQMMEALRNLIAPETVRGEGIVTPSEVEARTRDVLPQLYEAAQKWKVFDKNRGVRGSMGPFNENFGIPQTDRLAQLREDVSTGVWRKARTGMEAINKGFRPEHQLFQPISDIMERTRQESIRRGLAKGYVQRREGSNIVYSLIDNTIQEPLPYAPHQYRKVVNYAQRAFRSREHVSLPAMGAPRAGIIHIGLFAHDEELPPGAQVIGEELIEGFPIRSAIVSSKFVSGLSELDREMLEAKLPGVSYPTTGVRYFIHPTTTTQIQQAHPYNSFLMEMIKEKEISQRGITEFDEYGELPADIAHRDQEFKDIVRDTRLTRRLTRSRRFSKFKRLLNPITTEELLANVPKGQTVNIRGMDIPIESITKSGVYDVALSAIREGEETYTTHLPDMGHITGVNIVLPDGSVIDAVKDLATQAAGGTLSQALEEAPKGLEDTVLVSSTLIGGLEAKGKVSITPEGLLYALGLGAPEGSDFQRLEELADKLTDTDRKHAIIHLLRERDKLNKRLVAGIKDKEERIIKNSISSLNQQIKEEYAMSYEHIVLRVDEMNALQETMKTASSPALEERLKIYEQLDRTIEAISTKHFGGLGFGAATLLSRAKQGAQSINSLILDIGPSEDKSSDLHFKSIVSQVFTFAHTNPEDIVDVFKKHDTAEAATRELVNRAIRRRVVDIPLSRKVIGVDEETGEPIYAEAVGRSLEEEIEETQRAALQHQEPIFTHLTVGEYIKGLNAAKGQESPPPLFGNVDELQKLKTREALQGALFGYKIDRSGAVMRIRPVHPSEFQEYLSTGNDPGFFGRPEDFKDLKRLGHGDLQAIGRDLEIHEWKAGYWEDPLTSATPDQLKWLNTLTPQELLEWKERVGPSKWVPGSWEEMLARLTTGNLRVLTQIPDSDGINHFLIPDIASEPAVPVVDIIDKNAVTNVLRNPEGMGAIFARASTLGGRVRVTTTRNFIESVEHTEHFVREVPGAPGLVQNIQTGEVRTVIGRDVIGGIASRTLSSSLTNTLRGRTVPPIDVEGIFLHKVVENNNSIFLSPALDEAGSPKLLSNFLEAQRKGKVRLVGFDTETTIRFLTDGGKEADRIREIGIQSAEVDSNGVVNIIGDGVHKRIAISQTDIRSSLDKQVEIQSKKSEVEMLSRLHKELEHSLSDTTFYVAKNPSFDVPFLARRAQELLDDKDLGETPDLLAARTFFTEVLPSRTLEISHLFQLSPIARKGSGLAAYMQAWLGETQTHSALEDVQAMFRVLGKALEKTAFTPNAEVQEFDPRGHLFLPKHEAGGVVSRIVVDKTKKRNVTVYGNLVDEAGNVIGENEQRLADYATAEQFQKSLQFGTDRFFDSTAAFSAAYQPHRTDENLVDLIERQVRRAFGEDANKIRTTIAQGKLSKIYEEASAEGREDLLGQLRSGVVNDNVMGIVGHLREEEKGWLDRFLFRSPGSPQGAITDPNARYRAIRVSEVLEEALGGVFKPYKDRFLDPFFENGGRADALKNAAFSYRGFVERELASLFPMREKEEVVGTVVPRSVSIITEGISRNTPTFSISDIDETMSEDTIEKALTKHLTNLFPALALGTVDERRTVARSAMERLRVSIAKHFPSLPEIGESTGFSLNDIAKRLREEFQSNPEFGESKVRDYLHLGFDIDQGNLNDILNTFVGDIPNQYWNNAFLNKMSDRAQVDPEYLRGLSGSKEVDDLGLDEAQNRTYINRATAALRRVRSEVHTAQRAERARRTQTAAEAVEEERQAAAFVRKVEEGTEREVSPDFWEVAAKAVSSNQKYLYGAAGIAVALAALFGRTRTQDNTPNPSEEHNAGTQDVVLEKESPEREQATEAWKTLNISITGHHTGFKNSNERLDDRALLALNQDIATVLRNEMGAEVNEDDSSFLSTKQQQSDNPWDTRKIISQSIANT